MNAFCNDIVSYHDDNYGKKYLLIFFENIKQWIEHYLYCSSKANEPLMLPDQIVQAVLLSLL